MTRVLRSKRIAPKSGEMRSVVVFLHGYGANGDDLLGLAEPLAEHLPDTLFVSPDAPENCAGSPMGYQWFPIPWIDGSSEEESKKGMLSAVDDLNAFLDALMVDEDILPEHLDNVHNGDIVILHSCWSGDDQPTLVGETARWLAEDKKIKMSYNNLLFEISFTK